MIKGIYNAAANLLAKEKNIGITANNLANINTTGYKREIPFSEVIGRIDNQPSKQITDLSKGNFTQTGNQLDFAINGDAYFVVQTDRGSELTANGRFQVNDEYRLVDQNGNKVMGVNGEIDLTDAFIGKKRFEITKDGDIKIGNEIVNRLQIAKIDNPQQMERVSGQNFIFPEGGFSEADPEEYQIWQGYLEDSNINPIVEMQNMIKIEKEFESTQKIIQYLDQTMEKNREIGRF